MSEKVKFRGKIYSVSRYVDKPDKKLFTVAKQNKARELMEKGLDSDEIAEILNIDEMALLNWWENEVKRINISKAVISFNQGRSKKVICTDLNTGEEREFISLSSCARYCGCVASTILYKIKHNKKYKNYVFRYAED